MHFCPTCANILLVSNSGPDGFRFFCQTCPYIHAIKKPIAQRMYLKRKEVDDVLGGADAWKNVDQTEGTHTTTCTPQTQTHATKQQSKAIQTRASTRNRNTLLTTSLSSSLSLFFSLPLLPFPFLLLAPSSLSRLSEVRQPEGILHADPDSFRR